MTVIHVTDIANTARREQAEERRGEADYFERLEAVANKAAALATVDTADVFAATATATVFAATNTLLSSRCFQLIYLSLPAFDCFQLLHPICSLNCVRLSGAQETTSRKRMGTARHCFLCRFWMPLLW